MTDKDRTFELIERHSKRARRNISKMVFALDAAQNELAETSDDPETEVFQNHLNKVRTAVNMIHDYTYHLRGNICDIQNELKRSQKQEEEPEA